MDIKENVALLSHKKTSVAYAALQELEQISMQCDALYPYLDEFRAMLHSDKYVLRMRGIRLLCLQAKWDKDNRMGAMKEDILHAMHDEKPTAVRQVLQYLRFLVPYKKAWGSSIADETLALDCGAFNDSMQPLIIKDIQALVSDIHSLQTEDDQ